MAKQSVHVSKESAREQAPVQRESRAPARWLGSFDDLERVMDRMLERPWWRPMSWERAPWSGLMSGDGRWPRVDIVEHDKDVVIRAEVPGIERKDLDVSVSDSTVTIKGEAHKEEEEESGDYYRCERVRGAFARTLALPAEVDAEKVQAHFSDGVLEIKLPKVEQARRRKVEIK